MKNTCLSLLIIISLLITACSQDNAAWVNSNPAINVSIVSGNSTVNGTLNATVSGNVAISNTPLPVTISNSTLTVNASITNIPLPVLVSNTTSTINATIWAMTMNGTPSRLNIDPDGQLIVNNEVVLQEISEHGQLEGHTARAFHVMGRRAGFNSTSDLNDLKEFDSTNVTLFPTLNASQSLEIVSSSALDTFNGTGARSVEVTYIDSSNNLVTSANIALNGTTAVPAGFTANFIISMEVTSLGTLEVTAGNIILRVVGGATQEQITSGGNKSLSSHFMIPIGYTGYLTSWESSATSTGGATVAQDVRIRATVSNNGSLSTVYHFLDNIFVTSGTATSQIQLPYIKLPALTKIKVSTFPSATATTVRADASYCLYIVQN